MSEASSSPTELPHSAVEKLDAEFRPAELEQISCNAKRSLCLSCCERPKNDQASSVATGEDMNFKRQLIYCAVLSVAPILLPLNARADSDDDKKFLATAAQSDQNEIALSKLAEEKATNPSVKA